MLRIPRRFTKEGVDPFTAMKWKRVTAQIEGKEDVVFRQEEVEAPESWSDRAINITAQKYFRVVHGEKENSVRSMIQRVVNAITQWGLEQKYFDAENGAVFRDELSFLLLHQYGSFNSPVWFNLGTRPDPQVSACFISHVEDSLDSIMEQATVESRIFHDGSGVGLNLSSLREDKSSLSRGGTSSGPVSFMEGLDAFAGVIKSGGTTRRAAAMRILDVDHPDIERFITCKEEEQKKIQVMVKGGISGDFTDPAGAAASVRFQNANHSVRVSDRFMEAAEVGADVSLFSPRDKSLVRACKAKELLHTMARAAWFCGDPGIQFDDTINEMNPLSERIRASNPCSEFMFIDNSACNLASLNLMKFRSGKRFNASEFVLACRIFLLAQDIMVSMASYPTEKIKENSIKYRPLGLGYCNLGALLMSWGLPYDSDEGREWAAVITATMHGAALQCSAELAQYLSPYPGWEENKETQTEVLRKHVIDMLDLLESLSTTQREIVALGWSGPISEECVALPLRNAQVTLLAPTGTIAFMMDADTTGIEPELALVSYKRLVGGGLLNKVSESMLLGLKALGYTSAQAEEILSHVSSHGSLDTAPHIKERHLSVFDCSLRTKGSKRVISPEAHLRMMASVQPFLSGAISKTVNMPSDCTVEDFEKAFMMAWAYKLKAVALYRDGCKNQPVNTMEKEEAPLPPVTGLKRRKMPDDRDSHTHKFEMGGTKGYITVGHFPDTNEPGEVFVTVSKQGSTIQGLMDTVATLTSFCLQYGVPLEDLVHKFSHVRFEPSGFTKNPQIPRAKSLVDYIFRYLGNRYLMKEEEVEAVEEHRALSSMESDMKVCSNCGELIPSSGCRPCDNCGAGGGACSP